MKYKILKIDIYTENEHKTIKPYNMIVKDCEIESLRRQYKENKKDNVYFTFEETKN